MINGDDEVMTAEDEEPRFVECIGDGEGSPSIGAYRDSDGCVKRLPTRVVFHPWVQQKGLTSLQEQCFCTSQNPIPDFDQSVARQVGLDLSNMRTPSSISLMIMSFESSKRRFMSLVQVNGVLGFSSWRNGSMRVVDANA